MTRRYLFLMMACVGVASFAVPAYAANGVVFGPATVEAMFGTSIDGYVDAKCPTGAALTRVHVLADSYVTGVPDLYCSDIVKSNGKYVLSSGYYYVPGVTMQAGTLHDLACPAGSVVVGVNGRTGSWLDQVQLVCKPLRGNGTLGAATTTDPAGGNGGSSGYALCPAGTMVISARIYMDQADNEIDGFTLICRGIVHVAIGPQSGPKGTHVSVSGANYAPYEVVKVTYATQLSSPKTVTLCSAKAQPDGSFKCSGTIPTRYSGPKGKHAVTGIGHDSTLRSSTTFTLT